LRSYQKRVKNEQEKRRKIGLNVRLNLTRETVSIEAVTLRDS